MPTATATPYCFRCQYYPEPDEPALQRCSRCRSRHYCSRNCQRNDCPTHKQECAILAAGGQVPTRQRTTMRLTNDQLMAMAGRERQTDPTVAGVQNSCEVNDPDVIYYIKTKTPHLRDVSICGPFGNPDEVLQRLYAKLREARRRWMTLSTAARRAGLSISMPPCRTGISWSSNC